MSKRCRIQEGGHDDKNFVPKMEKVLSSIVEVAGHSLEIGLVNVLHSTPFETD